MKPETRYRWRLFCHYRRTVGLIKALRYTFGNYYVMPVDHEPTEYERTCNEFQRAHRQQFPDSLVPMVEGKIAMTPEVRRQIAHAMYHGATPKEMVEDDLPDIGYIGDKPPCGLGYTYEGEDDGA